MFIVKFQGGLGNQMFQYSLYSALGDMESIVVCPEFKNIYRDRFYACKGWKTIKNM